MRIATCSLCGFVNDILIKVLTKCNRCNVALISNDLFSDLIVNGELFETNSSTPEQPQSYFSKISVISDNTEIIFTQSSMVTLKDSPHI